LSHGVITGQQAINPAGPSLAKERLTFPKFVMLSNESWKAVRLLSILEEKSTAFKKPAFYIKFMDWRHWPPRSFPFFEDQINRYGPAASEA
jgi:hypothetical protein